MSASLVGSEMCIRDSSGGDTAHPDPPKERRAPETFWGGVWGAVAPPKRAVSYTHLTLPTICSV
eukprot:10430403-Alexandrium_andersonii.AAC.1